MVEEGKEGRRLAHARQHVCIAGAVTAAVLLYGIVDKMALAGASAQAIAVHDSRHMGGGNGRSYHHSVEWNFRGNSCG